MITMSIAEQKSLFDLNLKMVDAPQNEQFVDDIRERLNKMEWLSLPRHTFSYDENDNLKFAYVSLSMKCDRRIKKNGKIEYLLLRNFYYDSIDDLLDDEITFNKIEELEQMFLNEKESFESERLLPKDVLFDGHRYCWRFEIHNDGTVEFVEKWVPEIKEDDENAVLP
jgi:hypothetical protein